MQQHGGVRATDPLAIIANYIQQKNAEWDAAWKAGMGKAAAQKKTAAPHPALPRV